MLTLSGIIIDYARINLAKSMISSTGDLAMNSALADYDSVLQDVYGLFAISQLEDDPEAALQRNVHEYFENTLINNDIMTQDEANSYVDGLVTELFEGDSANFMEMKVVDFTAEGIPDSALSNPYILKKQIVEYMKYRGPISISTSFLDGLDAFSKLGEQAKVTESKLEVDDALGDLQKKNKKLYDLIKDTHIQMDKYNPKDIDTKFKSIKKKLTEGNESIDNQIIYILQYDKPKTISSFGDGSASSSFSKIESLAKDVALFKTYKFTDSRDVKKSDNVVNESVTIEYNSIVSDLGSRTTLIGGNTSNGITRFFEAHFLVNKVKSENLIEDINNAVAYYNDRLDYYNDLDSEEKDSKTGLKDDLDDASRHISNLEAFRTEFESLYKMTQKTYADSETKMSSLINDLNTLTPKIKVVDNIISYTDDILKLESKIKKELDNIETKSALFETAITDYKVNTTPGDSGKSDNFSTSMTSDHVNKAKSIDEKALGELMDRAQAINDYFNGARSAISNMKYRNQSFYDKTFIFGANKLTLSSKSEFVSAYKKNKSTTTITSGISNIPEIEKESNVKKFDASPDNEYYRYLEREFPTAKTDSTASKDYKTKLDTANEKVDEPKDGSGTKGLKETNPLPKDEEAKKVESDEGEYGIVEEVGLRSINDIGQPTLLSYEEFTTKLENDKDKDKEDSTVNDTHVDSDFEDKDAKASDSFSFQSSIVQKIASDIGQLTVDARDNFYVMEYILRNFTLDTTGIYPDDSDDKDEPKIMLSNYSVDSNSNYLYRGEVEYILYGKDDLRSNVRTAKAQIYAIRLVVNSIFAFTDAGIKAETLGGATAISAATGGIVPIPLTQAILQLALAMAESVIDINELSKGEAVVLFKSPDTWALSLRSMPQTIGDEVNETVQRKINKSINELNELMITLSEKTTSEVKDHLEKLKVQLISGIKTETNKIITSNIDLLINDLYKSIDNIYYNESGELLSEKEIFSDDISVKIISEIDQLVLEIEVGIKSQFVEEPLATIVPQIISSLKSSYVSDLKEWVGNQSLNTMVELDIFSDKIKDQCLNILESNAIELQVSVSGMLSDVTSNIDTQFAEFSSSTSEKLGEEVSKYTSDQISSFVSKTENIMPVGDGNLLSKRETKGSSMKTMISFDYDDYVKLFLFLKLAVDEEEAMTRVSHLIQTNLNTGEFVHNFSEYKNISHSVGEVSSPEKGFDIKRAYTYISIDSTVTLEPMFLDLGWFDSFRTDEDQYESFKSITYQGIKGY